MLKDTFLQQDDQDDQDLGHSQHKGGKNTDSAMELHVLDLFHCWGGVEIEICIKLYHI